MKKVLILIILAVLFCSISAIADCYLTVEKAGSQNAEMLQNQAETFLSQYVEIVKPIPFGGIGSDSCLYKISLMENREGFYATISGENLQSDGFSKETGFKGAKQALLLAIFKAKPEKQDTICATHSDLIPEKCGVDLQPEPQNQPKRNGSDVTEDDTFDRPPPRQGQAPGRGRNPCEADIREFCDFPPGPKQQQCFLDNYNKLSKGCQQSLRKMRNELKKLRTACSEDIKTYCRSSGNDMKKIRNCMRRNHADLSRRCKNAIKSLRRPPKAPR